MAAGFSGLRNRLFSLFWLIDAVTLNERCGVLLVKLCSKIADRINGDNNSNIRSNGELSCLKENLHDGDVVFDVGAHTGKWARMCLAIRPNIHLHCFEPSRFTFQMLAAAGLPPSARLNNCGLGSAEGPATLRIVAEGHPLNSLYLRQDVAGISWANRAEPVTLTTLDRYCADNDIPKIDFLKIDTEGHDLEVLKGASRMLADQRIGLIQFEYDRSAIDARVFLKDIFAFTRSVCPGAIFWKILPHGLWRIDRYRQDLETFRYANYLIGIAGHPRCRNLRGAPMEEPGPTLPYLANHYVKRATQTLAIRREERRCKRRSPRAAPLPEEAIQKALKERLGAVRFKPEGGLRILFVGHGLPGYNDSNIYPALERFGTLTLFHPGVHRGMFSAGEWKRQRAQINKELLSLVEKMPAPPDILIGQMWGWQIDPQTLIRLKPKVGLIVNYSWDDTLAFYGMKSDGVWNGLASLAPVVDLNLTSSKGNLRKYEAEGGLALFWPEGANPAIHRPLDVPFDCDVSFVGARYGYRPLLVDFLRRHGARVEAFGPGWRNGILPDEEMVALYSRSRINLGFGGIGHMVRTQHLKGRDFEIPMSGGLYLTSRHPDLEGCYEVGREIVCYSDARDCLEKIRHLLDHPDEAAAIRKAGRQRALRDHTWGQRFRNLFRLVGLFQG